MATWRFHQLDVFTTTPLAGNPLAVFPDARGLDVGTMQGLAREMNLSETTFVLPPRVATRRVRFFTPAAEIPLAGHPTIGTWWLLAKQPQYNPYPVDRQVSIIYVANQGHIDDVPVNRVRDFERGFLQYLTDKYARVLEQFRATKELTADISDALNKAVVEFKKDFK